MLLEILIDVAKSMPGVLLAAAAAYLFSQRRYTFEKLHDRKLLCIENLYGKVVSLEKDLSRYISTTGSMTYRAYSEERKKELKPIQDKFFELQEYFWKKEILLEQSSIDSIQNFIDVSVEILSKLQVSNVSSELRDDQSSYKLWDSAYHTMQGKLLKVKDELKRDFKKVIKR